MQGRTNEICEVCPKPENETVEKLKVASWMCFSGRKRRRSNAQERTQRGANSLRLTASRRGSEGQRGLSRGGSIAATIAQNASTGPLEITLTTRFGHDHGDQQFTVGDPPPIIMSVSPAVWQAGTSNLPITISGSGFGTSPTVTVVGTGVSLVSVGSMSDTQISATVSIASNAPNGSATVTVQSTGYNGSGFQPETSGEPSSSSYNVGVQAVPGPAPTILLYATINITNQTTTMYSGQQIALSATVNLPQGHPTAQAHPTPSRLRPSIRPQRKQIPQGPELHHQPEART